jgi:hypothetical protein
MEAARRFDHACMAPNQAFETPVQRKASRWGRDFVTAVRLARALPGSPWFKYSYCSFGIEIHDPQPVRTFHSLLLLSLFMNNMRQ